MGKSFDVRANTKRRQMAVVALFEKMFFPNWRLPTNLEKNPDLAGLFMPNMFLLPLFPTSLGCAIDVVLHDRTLAVLNLIGGVHEKATICYTHLKKCSP
jgi:hypothetical protein